MNRTLTAFQTTATHPIANTDNYELARLTHAKLIQYRRAAAVERATAVKELADMLFGFVATATKRILASRRTLKSLEQLDARTLADIGIERSDIPAIARAIRETGGSVMAGAPVTVTTASETAVNVANTTEPQRQVA